VVPAQRVDATGLEAGECSIQCSFEERRSMREEIVTVAVARHRHKQSGEREGNQVQYMINKEKNIERINRRGKS
jgi:hypothetical protein